MVAYARRKLLGGERQAVFHCWTRCVRRAYLCGRDRLTQKYFAHRRDWIIHREEPLASLFAIEIRKNAADRPDAWLGEFTLQPERKLDETLVFTSCDGRCVLRSDAVSVALRTPRSRCAPHDRFGFFIATL